MKISGLILVVLASMLVAVPASSQDSSVAATSTMGEPPASAFLPHGAFGPRQLVFFGYVKSLTRSGARYVMRVDPALVLSGITGTRAAVEDKVIRPGDRVPNDYYYLDLGHRLLTYRVPADAHVTVLTNPGTGPGSTAIPVSEFSQVVKGRNPKKRPGLWGPASGFWIRVAGDRALAFDQAYRP